MDLVKIAGPAHYLPGRVNIGVIVGDGQAALIDTGLDESAARKAVQAVEQAGLRLAAVINTHSHADHCGGNAFVVKRTGAPIYAPPVEAALIQHTEFEPFFLFGAAPFKAIDSKWFHAAPTPVAHVLDANVTVCGVELEVLPAAGHSMNQVAIATTEVAYLADALMALEILERYPIQYCYDVLGHRATLDRLAMLRRDWYVGAHFPPTQDLHAAPRGQPREPRAHRGRRLRRPAARRHHGRGRAGRGRSPGRPSHGSARLPPQRGRREGPPVRPRSRGARELRDPGPAPPLAPPRLTLLSPGPGSGSTELAGTNKHDRTA